MHRSYYFDFRKRTDPESYEGRKFWGVLQLVTQWWWSWYRWIPIVLYICWRDCNLTDGSKTFSKIDISETIVFRSMQFPLNFECESTSLRTYFHTISVSNNWVVFSALRILSTEIARKFWRIERTIRTCFCIQFIWRISCDPLYLQLFRCWIPSGSHLVHILDKLMNVLVCVIRAKHRIWSLKKFAHSSGWS